MSKRGKGPWICSKCGPGGKHWSDPVHTREHVAQRHPGDPEAKAIKVPKSERRKQEEREESYADRAIDAALDRAMGVHNPDGDWLLP